MLTMTQFRDRVVAWVRQVANLQAIVADQNAPELPTGAYIAIRFDKVRPVGYDSKGDIDDAGIRKIRGEREFVLTMNGHRTGAGAALQALQDSLEAETVLAMFDAVGLVFVDTSDVINLTGAIDSTRVERHLMEVFLRAGSEFNEDVDFFNTVRVSGTLRDAAGVENEMEEFTVGLA